MKIERMKLYNEAIELRRKTGWGSKKIAHKLGMSIDTVGGWLYKGRKPLTNYLIPTLEATKELAYVIGVCYGDGFLSKGRVGKYHVHRIRLIVKDKDFAEEFSRCISQVLSREIAYPTVIKSGFYEVDACSEVLFDFLKRPLREHKSVIEKFPADFLRGFFDSEGWGTDCLDKRGRHRGCRVYAVNTNLELLQYVSCLLDCHFSIASKLTIKHERGAVRVIKGNLVKATKTCYLLNITRCNDAVTFIREIGFTIKRKQEKLAGRLGADNTMTMLEEPK